MRSADILAKAEADRVRTRRSDTVGDVLTARLTGMFGSGDWTKTDDVVLVDHLVFDLTPLGELRVINTQNNQRALVHRPADVLKVVT